MADGSPNEKPVILKQGWRSCRLRDLGYVARRFGYDAICSEYNDAPASEETSGARVDRCRCRRHDVAVPTRDRQRLWSLERSWL